MISQYTQDGRRAAGPGDGPRGHYRLPGQARGRVLLRGLGALSAATAAVTLMTAFAGTAPAAGPARTAANARLASATAVPRCHKGKLVAGLSGHENASDQGGFILTLTSTSQESCSLDGYPGLGLQDASHQALTSHVHWGSTVFAPDPGRRLIVLSPGETLSASVSFGYTGKYPLHAAYLEITPPGAYRHLVVAIPDGTGNGSNGNLYVTALARHTAYQVTPPQCCEG
jgi:Protein of unknown function (DUF4232)